VEGDASKRHFGRELFLAQIFAEVPGYSLSISVRVGCEIDAIGVFEGLDDVAEGAVGAFAQLPIHGEAVGGSDRAVFTREVADMAEGVKSSPR
jgi:hypothetical protein